MSPEYIRMKMFIQLTVGFGAFAGWVFWPYWLSVRVMTLGCMVYFAAGFIVAGLLAWLAWRSAFLNAALTRWRHKQDESPVNHVEVEELESPQ